MRRRMIPSLGVRGGETWILSNGANQQNWVRTLVGLSRLTGQSAYEQAAFKALEYMFGQARYGDMFSWGGHMAIDLNTKRSVFASDKGPQHELKCHYPCYDVMAEVNLEETRKYVEAVWDGHVANWANLEFNRHGQPKPPREGLSVWDREYAAEDVFFTGKGLTFINAGSDLYYAAAMLHRLTGDAKPLEWAKRLARRYVETRNPQTGLGGYQFSISVLPGIRGDRAIDQFGEQLKKHSPIEATLSVVRQIHTIIGESALCRMALADQLGEAGKEFGEWAVQDLLAYGEYAYDAADNTIHPMLTDGTRLTGLVMEKSGYYGKQGDTLKAAAADLLLLWSFAAGYRLSRNERLWDIARAIARGNGLGDIGSAPTARGGAESAGLSQTGSGADLNSGTECADPHGIFAMLELHRITRNAAYLHLAERIGRNIVAQRYHHGFFMPSERHVYAKFDRLEPVALLHLAAELDGTGETQPIYCGGKSFFGAAFDGHGHEIDNDFIYGQTR
ncbi:hypothetical protein [Paenibacillus hamazuiensis]|uniref:hypothetical protein n=1 Tax=Paenibacillus hamazuiensis TaxID=2936508 RepID=UPI0020102D5D|nr:hypothetical protein [Paenibacillus hamazuiensis]